MTTEKKEGLKPLQYLALKQLNQILALNAENERLANENARLRRWLQRIDGGKTPCKNALQLRGWAYAALYGLDLNEEKIDEP